MQLPSACWCRTSANTGLLLPTEDKRCKLRWPVLLLSWGRQKQGTKWYLRLTNHTSRETTPIPQEYPYLSIKRPWWGRHISLNPLSALGLVQAGAVFDGWLGHCHSVLEGKGFAVCLYTTLVCGQRMESGTIQLCSFFLTHLIHFIFLMKYCGLTWQEDQCSLPPQTSNRMGEKSEKKKKENL